jgi:hypothetical protein
MVELPEIGGRTFVGIPFGELGAVPTAISKYRHLRKNWRPKTILQQPESRRKPRPRTMNNIDNEVAMILIIPALVQTTLYPT